MKHFYIPEISGRCPLRQPRQNALVIIHQILTSPSADMVKLGVKIEVQVEPKKLIKIFKVYTKFQVSSTSMS